VEAAGARQHLHFAYEANALVAEPDTSAPTSSVYSAFGWDREQIQLVEQMSANGAEPIRSLGHDGPLAALSKERQNLADYIKESVAVVTNPAIDRDREMEHFSTRVVIGTRVPLSGTASDGLRLELPSPLLFEGQSLQETAQQQGTLSLEQVIHYFNNHPSSIAILSTHFERESGLEGGLKRLQESAVQAVQNGAVLIVLDDTETHQNGRYWIDPLLAVSAVDQGLKAAFDADGISLRRRAGIILRSGAVRSLHDLALSFGSGADAVSPYLMFATAFAKAGAASAANLYAALNKGLEKVISTIGIHELRGYGRLFSSIGLQAGRGEGALHRELLRFRSGRPLLCRSGGGQHQTARGLRQCNGEGSQDVPHFPPPVETDRTGRRRRDSVRRLRVEAGRKRTGQPDCDSSRTTDFAFDRAEQQVDPAQVDISVGDHSLPFLISSMSFGSQNETAFRAYAEAANS
jgi:glutamate synthase (NADPH/NADH) large chain